MDPAASQQVTAEQFRLGMRRLSGAVTIVTAAHQGHRFGLTATAVCSATAEPPTALVCVNRSAATHAAIAGSGAFCINILRTDDAELANAFSGTQSGEARFRAGEWLRLASGAPALASALASFDCRVANRLDHGTHTVFLGEVASLVLGRRGKPLLYASGQYARLMPLAHGAPLPEGFDHWVDV
ncbi:MAG: flavin reductase [Betaproteobacteria bacterium]|nr:MAG: flavin reductase [Betaproteobacteria bacterium]